MKEEDYQIFKYWFLTTNQLPDMEYWSSRCYEEGRASMQRQCIELLEPRNYDVEKFTFGGERFDDVAETVRLIKERIIALDKNNEETP